MKKFPEVLKQKVSSLSLKKIHEHKSINGCSRNLNTRRPVASFTNEINMWCD